MNKQVFSIQQMQELIDMGIDTSKASFFWYAHCITYSKEKIVTSDYCLYAKDLNKLDLEEERIIPTFTLQDVLEITSGTVPQLWRKDGIPTWHIHDYFVRGHFIGTDLIDIAFKYIKWCKEQKYI